MYSVNSHRKLIAIIITIISIVNLVQSMQQNTANTGPNPMQNMSAMPMGMNMNQQHVMVSRMQMNKFTFFDDLLI